ncbi:MAG: hypothetical protein A2Y33_00445 [Spirochaetes bacterium GWF1_51_8]|nr:MAG: hypothetical protein A2Y33_00445 [Spirochaetes bacterium GWF1_51_8]
MIQNLREIEGNVTAEMNHIEHDGPLTIKGDIESGSFIVATGDIHVIGEVQNSKVKSIKGNITIEAGIAGVNSIVYANGGEVRTKYVYNSTVKSETDIHIMESAIDAHLIAKRSLFVFDGEGKIEGGETEAGIDIVANLVGNNTGVSTVVKISDFKQRELFAQLTRLDYQIKEITDQMSHLEKFIEVIRLLGNKVITLPMEKKQDLALKVKKYNELKVQMEKLREERGKLSIEQKNDDELERTIIVRQYLFSGVYVYMDKAKLPIQHTYSNVILYKRGIIIVGDYDKFMHRKKYSY